MLDFMLNTIYIALGVGIGLPLLAIIINRLFGSPTKDDDFRKWIFDRYLNAKDYCVLEATEPAQLEKMVNAAIAYGYRPVGCVSHGKGVFSDDKWVQAVEKIG